MKTRRGFMSEKNISVAVFRQSCFSMYAKLNEGKQSNEAALGIVCNERNRINNIPHLWVFHFVLSVYLSIYNRRGFSQWTMVKAYRHDRSHRGRGLGLPYEVLRLRYYENWTNYDKEVLADETNQKLCTTPKARPEVTERAVREPLTCWSQDPNVVLMQLVYHLPEPLLPDKEKMSKEFYSKTLFSHDKTTRRRFSGSN